MADHSFQPGPKGLEVAPIVLWGSFDVGATGAVSNTAGKGITSVTRNSAGNYTVLLDAAYTKLLHANMCILNSTLSDPTSVGIFSTLYSEAVATVAAPAVTFQFVALDDGAAADPASGAKVYFRVELGNSSV